MQLHRGFVCFRLPLLADLDILQVSLALYSLLREVIMMMQFWVKGKLGPGRFFVANWAPADWAPANWAPLRQIGPRNFFMRQIVFHIFVLDKYNLPHPNYPGARFAGAQSAGAQFAINKISGAQSATKGPNLPGPN